MNRGNRVTRTKFEFALGLQHKKEWNVTFRLCQTKKGAENSSNDVDEHPPHPDA